MSVLVGAVAGFVVYTITKTGGRNLFILTGAVAGVVTVVALQFFGRSTSLTQVKLKIPHLSELTFVVNSDARLVAWRLYIEIVTRIASQPLDADHGSLREAMNSLYALFGTTRQTLKEGVPSARVAGGRTVEQLAIAMLNRELRPFLSHWHPRLAEYQRKRPTSPESAWPENEACRSDLARVQENIVAYALGFAALAGVRDAESMVTSRQKMRTSGQG